MFRMTAVVLCVGSFSALGIFQTTAGEEARFVYRPGPPVRYQVGVEVEAESPCRNLVALLAVPRDWPEQKVREISRESDPRTARIRYDDNTPGARLMEIRVPRLNAGQQARVVVEFEVITAAIGRSLESGDLQRPKRLNRELQRYFGRSPQIETDHPQIVQLAKTFGDLATPDDWSLVEAIYDEVRKRVTYRFDEQPRGALHALTTGFGDCEEMTSLFVAVCRRHGIPARSVWVDGHTYPEFYLVDSDQQGHWFPCQAAGDRAFGELPPMQPILQKGDRFRIPRQFRQPGQPAEERYVGEHVRATPATAGATPPRVRIVREVIAASDSDPQS